MMRIHPVFIVYVGLAVAAVAMVTAPPGMRLVMGAGGLIATAIVAGAYALWWRWRYGPPS